jgi:preprotein translocase subunit SecE
VIGRIRRYFSESYSELKKVTWPTREHVRNLTVLVFVISAIFGVYIGFFDLVWSRVLRFITLGTL